MHTRSYIQSRSGSRDGVALIAVLVFIVLLTILTVSYISFTGLNRLSTTSYSKSIQAQEVAQGGLEDILSDLHSEIIAGSIPDPGGVYTPTSGGPTIYVPSTNLTAMPARIGYVASNYNVTNATPTQISTTLIRVSRCTNNVGATFFTAPPSYYGNFSAVPGGAILDRASQASTTNADVGGRYISAARWNKTYLLATNSSASVIPLPFATNAPDWIYVTRTGSRSCLPSDLPSLKPSSNLTQNYGATVPGQNPPVSPVVGRYAFVMYDEGALLDATVAGSPSALMANNGTAALAVSSPLPLYTNSPSATPPVNTSLAFTGKSYLTFADLTQLPGLSSTAGQTAVNNFVNWRNAGGIANANSAYGNTFLGAIFGYAQNGFLSFSSGDSPILGRQDLINYFAKIDPSINTTSATFSQALPYLGTFSRAVSAPSYTPPTDSQNMTGFPGYVSTLGTAVAYKDNAENTGVANRDLANVRYPPSIAAGTLITHYADDTTAKQYAVNPGDPLLKNRFSLARIGWLSSHTIGGADPGNGANPATGASPSAAYATAIQACFGLTWGTVGSGGIANGGNPCWTYTGSTGNTAASTIETLDQVAKEAREPNFFELLKAAILNGSLGLSPGPAGWNNGLGFPETGETPFSFKDTGLYAGGSESLDAYSFDRVAVGATPIYPAPAGIADVQIIKIGADIIDQYDTDSYPTAIYFPYTAIKGSNYDAANFTALNSGTGPQAGDISGPSDMVYGEENLPYIQGFYQCTGTTDGSAPNGPPATATLGGWILPELWNPHQKPIAANLTSLQTGTIPASFKIRGYGTTWVYWINNSAQPGTGDTTATALDNDYITFTDPNPTSSVFYAHPAVLTANLGLSSLAPGGTDKANMVPSNMANYSLNPIVGFWMGYDTTYTVLPDPNEAQSRMQTTGGVTFCLGWTDSNGGFHPYSYIQQIVGYSYSVLGENDASDTEHGSAGVYGLGGGDDEWHVYLDPRTFRFSDLAGWASSHFNSTFFPDLTPDGPQLDQYGQGKPYATNFNWVPYVYGESYNEYSWDGNSSNTAATSDFNNKTYYADPDGVVRPADGVFSNATTSSYDGNLLFIVPGVNGTAVGDTAGTGDGTGNNQHGRRAVILNRPFRSLGELGYVFRDLPFKTLDFFSSVSADAALLDVFSLTDESTVNATTSQITSVVGGQFNPNNAPMPVIQAVLSGGSKKDLDPTYNLGAEATSSPTVLTKIAAAIVKNLNPTTGPNPIMNRAALVTQLQPAIQSIPAAGGTIVSSFTSNSDKSNKAYLEAPVRALADVTNTRTWNLMIDIIAQSGQMSSSAKTLNDFVVQGERRYWLHVAIDRYTGKIVSQQLEPVYE